MWVLYVLRCGDDTLYTGIARDLTARLAQHRAGKGAKYTRGRGPLVLLAKAPCQTQSEALKLERAIKQLTRVEKLAILATARRFAGFVKRWRNRTAT